MAIIKEDKSIHLHNYHTQQHTIQNFYKNETILLQKSLEPFYVSTTYIEVLKQWLKKKATSYVEEDSVCCYRTGDNNYRLYIL
jgi:hypothetical protein